MTLTPIEREKLARAWKDLAGLTFNRLAVLKRVENDKHQKARWLCRCQCGKETIVTSSLLTSGKTKSCGCLRIDKAIANGGANATHGMSRSSREYRSWNAMRSRCLNKNNPAYDRYGGRGVTICDRWSSFENFLADMGPRPSWEHSIDRYPDRNGNYEPGNCRWATPLEQTLNRSLTKLNEEQVRAIRADPRICREIARDYGVSERHIGHIRRGGTWEHVK